MVEPLVLVQLVLQRLQLSMVQQLQVVVQFMEEVVEVTEVL